MGVQVKLRNSLRTRAIPERFAAVIHYEEALYQVYAPLTLLPKLARRLFVYLQDYYFYFLAHQHKAGA